MRRNAMNVGAMALNKPEVKNSDIVSSITQLTAVYGKWTVPVLLNGIAGGTTRTTRVGGSITMTKEQLRCYVNTVGSTAAPPVRVAVVYDKQPPGSLPAVTDIWAADDFNSWLNISNSDRFLIIFDDIIQSSIGIDGTNGVAGIAQSYFKKFPSPGFQQKFLNNNGATIADVTAGAMYIMMATAPGSTATSTTLTYYNRIRFTDF